MKKRIYIPVEENTEKDLMLPLFEINQLIEKITIKELNDDEMDLLLSYRFLIELSPFEEVEAMQLHTQISEMAINAFSNFAEKLDVA